MKKGIEGGWGGLQKRNRGFKRGGKAQGQRQRGKSRPSKKRVRNTEKKELEIFQNWGQTRNDKR